MRWRITPFRFMILFFLCGFIYLLWRALSGGVDSGGPLNCHVPSKVQEQAIEIAVETSRLLSVHKITHFLCYGSLWGALRGGQMLAWESNVDLCAMNEDISKLDYVFLLREFKKNGLQLEYDSKTGIYTVWKDSDKSPTKGIVEINVFERLPDLKRVRRIGWKHRLLPPSADNIDSFPDFLIELPLSKTELAGHTWPAAKEGIEIQKYHYKDNWWKDIRPPECAP